MTFATTEVEGCRDGTGGAITLLAAAVRRRPRANASPQPDGIRRLSPALQLFKGPGHAARPPSERPGSPDRFRGLYV